MNKWIGMGRLTRDPEIRHTQNAEPMTIARFTIAVDRRFKKDGDEQTADFISCVAFGKTADFIEKYYRQGLKVVIEGRIQTGSYTDRDGKKVYTTDIVIEQTEFAESKQSQQQTGQQTGQQGTPSNVGDGFMNIPDGIEDDGLPFY